MSMMNINIKNISKFLRLSLVVKTVILLTIASLLSCCGFAVRSNQAFPPKLQQVYVQSDAQYGKLAVLLRHELHKSNINLVENSQNAQIIMNISKENFTYSKDSINSPSTQARIYYLTMSTTFNLQDNHGNTILEPQTISTNSNLTLNSNEIFATSTQTDLYKQNMRSILITKIFDLLLSKQILEKLQ